MYGQLYQVKLICRPLLLLKMSLQILFYQTGKKENKQEKKNHALTLLYLFIYLFFFYFSLVCLMIISFFGDP